MTALYRKYRPQRFEDLVGQEAIRLTLLQALKLGRLSHAYLFSGPRGTGKTSTARLIARAIQCENRLPTGEACGVCELCTMNEAGTLVDLIEIDAASNRGIDEIRDLKEKIRFAPTRAQSKVYIIDEVHMLSKDAFNALLKTLEEPPAHVFFILATTELHKIPETIISRCQRYEFKRVSEAEIEAHLARVAEAEGLTVEPRALALLARSADGGLRDALTLLDQLSGEVLTEALVADRLGLSSRAAAEALVEALAQAQTEEALRLVGNVHREGQDLSSFTQAVLGLLRDALHQRFRTAPRSNATAALNPTATPSLQTVELPHLLRWIDLFDEAWMKLKRTSIATLPLELAVVRCGVTGTPHPVAAPQAGPVAAQPNKVVAPANAPASPVAKPESVAAVPAEVPAAAGDLLKLVVSKLSQPALKGSLLTARLQRPDDDTVELQFATQFHREQVEKSVVFATVQAAFAEVLGHPVRVLCVVSVPQAPAPKANVDLGWPTTEEPLS